MYEGVILRHGTLVTHAGILRGTAEALATRADQLRQLGLGCTVEAEYVGQIARTLDEAATTLQITADVLEGKR